MAERTCAVDGCSSPVKARGWCRQHYLQWYRTGDPIAAPIQRVRRCVVDGCTEPAHCRGWCRPHYARWKYAGDPVKAPTGAPCAGCGTVIYRPDGRRRFCGECRSERDAANDRAKTRRYRDRTWEDPAPRRQRRSAPCPVCGGEVVQAAHAGPLRRFCGDECWEAYEHEWRRSYRARNRDKLQTRQHRRRALKQGAEYEVFRPSDIFERDGWRCYLCSEQIDSDLDYPHPRRVVLEHIVPLERGGGHTQRNVAAAHSICNSIKGIKLLSEMPWQADRHCFI